MPLTVREFEATYDDMVARVKVVEAERIRKVFDMTCIKSLAITAIVSSVVVAIPVTVWNISAHANAWPQKLIIFAIGFGIGNFLRMLLKWIKEK